MPSLGLGTFRLKAGQAIDAVATGLELGYRHIDTAQIHGNEAEVGQALAASGVARADGKVMDDATIARIARERGATPAQVALAWALARGHAVIPSSTRRANLEGNLRARDLAAIDALDRGERLVDPDFAPRRD